MKIRIRDHQVSVKGKGVRQAIKSHLFKKWVESLDPIFIVVSIEIQSVDTVKRNGKEKVLFLKLKAEITDETGRVYPGIIFLRGDSVAILAILETPEQKYVVVIESHLPSIGKRSSLQLPAGMMDDEVDALQVAWREMEEETGLDPALGLMTRLGHIYPSPGACDEAIHLFLFEAKMSEAEVLSLQDTTTGLAEEGEQLIVKLVKLEELCPKTQDPKAHSAHMLYCALKMKGNNHGDD
jgi:ADP-sugar diphosphatase